MLLEGERVKPFKPVVYTCRICATRICSQKGKNIITLVANLPYVNSLLPVNKGFGIVFIFFFSHLKAVFHVINFLK